jgi:hypothetical protein
MHFVQSNTSIELELWWAFWSVEDVCNLLTMAKKAPRPAIMANYYENLTKTFLASKNTLFHATVWGRYYAIVINIRGKSDEELGWLVRCLSAPWRYLLVNRQTIQLRKARERTLDCFIRMLKYFSALL